MIKHVYDTFAEKYYHDGTIYFYSDPHFSDLDSYKLRFPELFHLPFDFIAEVVSVYKKHNIEVLDALTCISASKALLKNEPTSDDAIKTVELLDKLQIDNINKVCSKKDTLIILGDIGNIECIKKLKAGYKVLVMGNHDKGASNYKRSFEAHHVIADEEFRRTNFRYDNLSKNGYCLKFEHYQGEDGVGEYWEKIEDNHLFDEVYEGTLQIGPKIILSHEPVDYPYCINIHGHVHNRQLTAFTEHIHPDHTSYSFNCCAEQINYRPVCINSFFTANGIFSLSKVLDIHRKTIDIATERKKKRGKKHE